MAERIEARLTGHVEHVEGRPRIRLDAPYKERRHVEIGDCTSGVMNLADQGRLDP